MLAKKIQNTAVANLA